MTEFVRNLAVVIGINQYQNGIQPLNTAVQDAHKLADILQTHHHYQLIHPTAESGGPILDGDATLLQLRDLFTQTLPKQVQPNQSDRLLIYFAGHGITRQVDDQGPQGFLVPQDADINNPSSLLSMGELYKALNQLECRHLLVILDCCFAGMFRWASTRKVVLVPETIHWEHYHRFIKYPAWQVITSAAHNQEALDYLDNRSTDKEDNHSPFAQALFEGLLAQKADLVPDGVITSAELYIYLREYVEKHSKEQQTPGFWPLSKHDRGEYIFQIVPEHQLKLKAAPKLEKDNNPYRGLEAYEEKHAKHFFGREAVIEDLVEHISQPHQQFTVVDGASGSGKSSLVKAGLVHTLRTNHDSKWHVFEPVRPGTDPYTALANTLLPHGTSQSDVGQASEAIKVSPEILPLLVEAWATQHPEKKLLLVIDQFEELITLSPQQTSSNQKVQWGRRFNLDHLIPPYERCCHWLLVIERLVEALEDFSQLSLLVTLRSDFCPRFQCSALGSRWAKGRFGVRPMRSDELRETILGPANEMALYFEPTKLVDRLVDEVVQMPGALPLLSFTLSELYLKLHTDWVKEGKSDRALSVMPEFYGEGGVAGLLAKRANEEYENLPDDAHRRTLQRVMLRMVDIEGSETVKRRVPKKELLFVNAPENQRVAHVLAVLDRARLIVSGEDAGEPYVEPAHDFLVRGWDKLQDWIETERETLLLQCLLIPAARNWQKTKRDLWNGNSRLVLLKQIRKSRNNWLNQLEVLFVQRSLFRKRFNLGLRLSLVGLALGIGGVYWLVNDQWREATLTKVDALAETLQEQGDKLSESNQNLNQERRDSIRNKRVATQAIRSEENALEQAQEEQRRAAEAANQAQGAKREAKQEVAKQHSVYAEALTGRGKPTEAILYAINAVHMSQENNLWDDALPSAIPVSLMTAVEESRELTVLKMPEEMPEEMSAGEEVSVRETEADIREDVRNAISVVAIAADNQTILSGDRAGNLSIWNSQNPSAEPISTQGMGGTIKDVFPFSKSQAFVWVSRESGDVLKNVKIEDLDSDSLDKKSAEGTVISLPDTEKSPISIAIAANNGAIAIGYPTGEVIFLNEQSEVIDSSPESELSTIESISLSPNGKLLVVAGKADKQENSQLQLWAKENDDSEAPWQRNNRDNLLQEDYQTIQSISFSPRGDSITVLGKRADGKSSLERLAPLGDLLWQQPIEISDDIERLALTKEGDTLAISHSTAFLWDSKGRLLLKEDMPERIASSAIAPDGKTIAFGIEQPEQSEIHLWEGIRQQNVGLYYLLAEIDEPVLTATKLISNSEVRSKSDTSEESPDPETANKSDAEAEDSTASESKPLEPEALEPEALISAPEESEERIIQKTDTDKSKQTDEESEGVAEEVQKVQEEEEDTASAEDVLEEEALAIEDAPTEGVSTEDVSTEDALAQQSDDESQETAIVLSVPASAQNKISRTLTAISANGQTLVSIVNNPEETSQPKQVKIRDRTSSDQLGSLESKSTTDLHNDIDGSVTAVSLSEDGQRVALLVKSAEENAYNVKVWDKSKGTGSFLKNPIPSFTGDRIHIQLTPDGRHLIAGLNQKNEEGQLSSKLQVWNLSASTQRAKASESLSATEPLKGELSALTISDDGKTLFTAISVSRKKSTAYFGYEFGGKSSLQAWHLQQDSAEETATLESMSDAVSTAGYVSAIALSQDGQTLATLNLTKPSSLTKRSADKRGAPLPQDIVSTVQFWAMDNNNLTQKAKMPTRTNMIGSFLSLMPDGKNVFVGGEKVVLSNDGISSTSAPKPALELISATNSQSVLQPSISQIAGQITSLSMTSEGKHMVAGIRQDNQLGSIVWDLSLSGLLHTGCKQVQDHHLIFDNSSVGLEAEKICESVMHS